MFETLKLSNEKRKSANEVKNLNGRRADREALLPASHAMQPACEAARLAHYVATLSQGIGSPPNRVKELEAECRRLESERDTPIRRANELIEAQAKITRAINHPFQSEFTSWGRQAMQSAPYNYDFTGYIEKAIAEIEGMSLQPLEKILEAIDRHQNRIETWQFSEKLRQPIPLLRLQDVLANA